ncbi:PepSY domain-containing protein [Aestuariibacter sp. AA17]|uniref:PepSY domain-containing protein n=1 Tax=Fluctibacter corallii TaxID=2984329 RepID=A0ABT3A5M7_9ALTE|nr:PepSY domain-containing protein [Aestuariibacter sp. AA17]MCV2883854.1 PepSY domain-containing protein [Aestuariibacter sp. AA17]
MKKWVSTLLLITCFLAAPTHLLAQKQDKASINKAQAAQRAKQVVQGRVLKVEQDSQKYRVKVLQKSGRVVSVDVDKRSGKVTTRNQEKGY